MCFRYFTERRVCLSKIMNYIAVKFQRLSDDIAHIYSLELRQQRNILIQLVRFFEALYNFEAHKQNIANIG